MFSSSSSASSADEAEDSATAKNNESTNPAKQMSKKRQKLLAKDRSAAKDRTAVGLPRREENHFSFRHFLKNDSQPNYQFAGARPKVYEPQFSTPEPNENHEPEIYPRNPTKLPDFVQDHLVIEQCYLDNEACSNLPVDDNLPDFALNSMEKRQPRYGDDDRQILRDLRFDLTENLDEGRRERVVPNVSRPITLNLPNLDVTDGESATIPESLGFPFDLQIPRAASNSTNVDTTANDCQVQGNPNVTKSLPDFLSDAPIRNRGTPSTDRTGCSSSNESLDHRLSVENERLRRELQIARRQASERSLRIESLEAELLSRRHVDHAEYEHLEKAMEQAEDNLKRSMRRAISAENTVVALKKEIHVLNMEISMLRTENRELRKAMGSDYNGCRNASTDGRIRNLAGDLRLAASTAEVSLRQLMSGVSNLRVLASALENVDRIEDRTKDFLPNFDEDNAAGPAL